MGADRIHEALMVADAVILAARAEPGRAPLIDRAALAAMPPGARLVNVARGALIDGRPPPNALNAPTQPRQIRPEQIGGRLHPAFPANAPRD